MSLSNGKHIVKELDGINCTIIEENVTNERAGFLKDLLTFNNLVVKVISVEQTTNPEPLYTVAVTDIIFNPVIAVYGKQLYTKNGRIVTPNYWNQKTEKTNIPYWSEGREIEEIYKLELKQ